MDDVQLLALATKLNQLTTNYMNGAMKHYTYATEYDKALENYGLTKKQLIIELEKRRNPINTQIFNSQK